MPDIMMLLACLNHGLGNTTVRRRGRIVEALLSMSGRVTMLGLSRWTESGGSYRTVQRFFNTTMAWGQVHWLIIRHHLLDREGVMLLAGDDVVVTKSGKKTHGLDRFFFLAVRQSGTGVVFFESVVDQCEAAVFVSAAAGAGGQSAEGRFAQGGQAPQAPCAGPARSS